MSKLIINKADEVNGVFSYNINGFNELISIVVKLDPESYVVEGAVFSVIKKGIDVESINMENIQMQELSYIVPSKEIKGPSSFELVFVKALEYVYLKRDHYMTMINEEMTNVFINDILYVSNVRNKRKAVKDEEKKRGVMSSIANLLKRD